MADRAVYFDDLLAMDRLRSATYEVIEPPGAALACIDASARRGPDWYFARRWIPVREGRRQFYATIDRMEAAGFRFRIETTRARPTAPAASAAESDEEWLRASELLADLEPAERRVHESLFPEEARLLALGYDWDDQDVYVRGLPVAADAFGRRIETAENGVFEWVRVPDEFTWRRYPLQRITSAAAIARGT